MQPNEKRIGHIDEAIALYKNILLFDLETYKDVVWAFAKQKNIRSKEDVNCLLNLSVILRTGEDRDIYYCIKSDESKIDVIRDDKEVEFDKTTYIKIDRISIKTDEKTKKIPASLWESNGKYFIEAIELINVIRTQYPSIQDRDEDVESYIVSLFKSQSTEDIQFFINYCYDECIEGARKEFLNKINDLLCFHLSKSFLNAEYLIFNNYSKRLDEVESSFIATDEKSSGEPFPALYLYPIKSFVKLAWYAKEACALIKRYIKKPDSNLVLVSTDREIRFNNLCKPDYRFEGKKESLGYERFVESIIDMTIIDHCYQTNSENIKKLLLLSERKESLSRMVIDNTKLDVVFQMSEAKMASLLYTMLIQSDKQNRRNAQKQIDYTFIINGKIGEEDLKSKIKHFCIKEDISLKNPFLKEKKSKENEILSFEKILPNQSVYSGEGSDINKYNESVIKGVDNYCLFSDFFHKNKTKEIQCSDIEAFAKEERYKYKTPSFYLQIITKLCEFTSNSIEEARKKEKLDGPKIGEIKSNIDLLKEVLNNLLSYIRKYAQSVPYQYRPLFSYSFYTCESHEGKVVFDYANEISDEKINTYNYNDFEHKFFFASLDCTPINVGYLELFYEKYENEHRILSALHDSLNSQYNEQTVQKTVNIIESRVSKESQEIHQKIQDELQVQRHQTITILGIFAAFLAFVTVSIGMISIAKDIGEYIVFCMAFMVSLFIFVVLIKHKPSIEKRKENEKNGFWKKTQDGFSRNISVIILLPLLVMICFLSYPIIKKGKDAETKETLKYIQSTLKVESDTLNVNIKVSPIDTDKKDTTKINNK